MSRQAYPTNLSDEPWWKIEPLLPAAKSAKAQGRKRTVNLREIVNAILYWSRSSCAWEFYPRLPAAQDSLQLLPKMAQARSLERNSRDLEIRYGGGKLHHTATHAK